MSVDGPNENLGGKKIAKAYLGTECNNNICTCYLKRVPLQLKSDFVGA